MTTKYSLIDHSGPFTVGRWIIEAGDWGGAEHELAEPFYIFSSITGGNRHSGKLGWYEWVREDGTQVLRGDADQSKANEKFTYLGEVGKFTSKLWNTDDERAVFYCWSSDDAVFWPDAMPTGTYTFTDDGYVMVSHGRLEVDGEILDPGDYTFMEQGDTIEVPHEVTAWAAYQDDGRLQSLIDSAWERYRGD